MSCCPGPHHVDLFEVSDEFVRHGLCGLCGNSGVIDNHPGVQSPAGKRVAVRSFCICPNGRRLKELDADIGVV
jgi:hypothetical protein